MGRTPVEIVQSFLAGGSRTKVYEKDRNRGRQNSPRSIFLNDADNSHWDSKGEENRNGREDVQDIERRLVGPDLAEEA